jgi:hypothetical protein
VWFPGARFGVFLAPGFYFMNLFQRHANALSELQGMLGLECPSIVWNGQTIPLIPGTTVDRKTLGIAGYAVDFDLKLFPLVKYFINGVSIATAQQAKDSLLDTPFTYLGDSYKVQSVDILPGALQLVIGANALQQGA